MPSTSVLFKPNISERDLAGEVDDVNDQLADAAEDIPASFDFEGGAGGGLEPPGFGGGGGGGMGGGMGPGGAGAVAGVASKLPGKVAGVTAAAAMPVALAGSVGLGMASAMTSASARLQTSSSILSQAWNNIWRPLGDSVDQLFIRDIATDLLSETESFGEAIRSGDIFGAAGSIGDMLFEGSSGNIGALVVSTVFPAALPAKITAEFLSGVNDAIPPINWGEYVPAWPGWPDVNASWPGWPSVGAEWLGWPEVGDMWPGWPDVGDLWPGWPDINVQWPGWPQIGALWPGWPNVGAMWADLGGWPDVGSLWQQAGGWPDIGLPEWPSTSQIMGAFPSINAGELINSLTNTSDWGNRETGRDETRGNGGGWWEWTGLPELQSGGRIQRSGVAEVHRGELVADPDRLVSELASAVSQASGGGRRRVEASVDTRDMERKLDELNRNVRRLADALSVEGVGPEEIARLSADGSANRVGDTNRRA